MSDVVSLAIADGIATVMIDNPPVNATSQTVRQGLLDAFAAIAANRTVKGAILACAGKTFVAGADIREFGKPPLTPILRDVIAAIENMEKPVVAAIQGTALGGGFELALGCHYRVMDTKALAGLPEVTLGIIPGAGGTQRLPRLIGISEATEMITTGRRISASEALRLGVADKISDGDLPGVARQYLREKIGQSPRRLSALPNATIPPGFFAAQRKAITARSRGQESPLRALDVLEQTATMSFAEGMAREAEVFMPLRSSEQAKALRHIFFAEREVAKTPESSAEPRPCTAAGVVGGGLMGSGISAALLLGGVPVTIIERDDTAADAARNRVLGLLSASVARGKLSQPDHDAIASGRLRVSSNYGDLSHADLVIEAVFEDMAAKQSVFAKLQDVTKPACVLATNTSYLDVGAIARSISRAPDVIGLHFFSPAHIMKLVEVVVPKGASASAVATGFALARRLGKIAVRTGVCDGFIGNRILSAYRKQADYLVEDGATPAQVDEAFRAFGLPMGVFEMQDMAGLEIGWANRKALAPVRDRAERYVHVGDILAERGYYGRKTGRGYYVHDGKTARPNEEALAIIESERERKNIVPRSFSADEIMDRIILAMINECARILDEAIALRAGDIDVVMVNGYGFPRWRGGPMFMADQMGSAEVLRRIEELAKDDAYFWRPSPLLRNHATTKSRFTSE